MRNQFRASRKYVYTYIKHNRRRKFRGKAFYFFWPSALSLHLHRTTTSLAPRNRQRRETSQSRWSMACGCRCSPRRDLQSNPELQRATSGKQGRQHIEARHLHIVRRPVCAPSSLPPLLVLYLTYGALDGTLFEKNPSVPPFTMWFGSWLFRNADISSIQGWRTAGPFSGARPSLMSCHAKIVGSSLYI